MSNDIRNKGRSRNWIDSEPDWKKWISFKLRAFTQCTHFHFHFFLQFVTFLFWFVLFCCSFNFPSWYKFILVSFNCWKFNFTYFSHSYDNYSMFRDVPECSMFLVLSTPVILYFRVCFIACSSFIYRKSRFLIISGRLWKSWLQSYCLLIAFVRHSFRCPLLLTQANISRLGL